MYHILQFENPVLKIYNAYDMRSEYLLEHNWRQVINFLRDTFFCPFFFEYSERMIAFISHSSRRQNKKKLL